MSLLSDTSENQTRIYGHHLTHNLLHFHHDRCKGFDFTYFYQLHFSDSVRRVARHDWIKERRTPNLWKRWTTSSNSPFYITTSHVSGTFRTIATTGAGIGHLVPSHTSPEFLLTFPPDSFAALSLCLHHRSPHPPDIDRDILVAFRDKSPTYIPKYQELMKEYDSSDEQEKQEAGRIPWKLMNEPRYVLVSISLGLIMSTSARFLSMLAKRADRLPGSENISKVCLQVDQFKWIVFHV